MNRTQFDLLQRDRRTAALKYLEEIDAIMLEAKRTFAECSVIRHVVSKTVTPSEGRSKNNGSANVQKV